MKKLNGRKSNTDCQPIKDSIFLVYINNEYEPTYEHVFNNLHKICYCHQWTQRKRTPKHLGSEKINTIAA